MDWHEQNIETYNSSAEKLAQYFSGMGARTDDIVQALELAGRGEESRVLEIGCGDGRDAEEIVERVQWYEGIDPSIGLLEIARRRLPDTSFTEADALSYHYPENLDVIFAFASLLHVSREELPTVFDRGYEALSDGGIYYISLKERSEYTEEVKTDEYGERMFYYYNVDLIKELAGSGFEIVYASHYTFGKSEWFKMALRKL